MSVLRYCFILWVNVCAFSLSTAFAQRPELHVPSAKMAVEEFDSSARLLAGQHTRAVADLNATYSREIVKLREALLEKLRSIQISATKEGKLDEAVEIRDAVEFYESFDPRTSSKSTPDRSNRKELIELRSRVKELEDSDSQARLKEAVGLWRGQFSTTKNLLTVRIHPNAIAELIGKKRTDTARVEIHNDRLIVMTREPMAFLEHFEFVPNGERLIALGWRRRIGEDPLRHKPSVVAVLERVSPSTSDK